MSDLLNFKRYRYYFKSHVETRFITEETEVYYGGPVDGMFNGEPPTPWSMNIDPAAPFLEL